MDEDAYSNAVVLKVGARTPMGVVSFGLFWSESIIKIELTSGQEGHGI